MLKYKPIIIIENGRQFSADLYNYTKEDFFSYINGLDYFLFQYTGGLYTESCWPPEKDVYWETWLVHKSSKHLDFFNNQSLLQNPIGFARGFAVSRPTGSKHAFLSGCSCKTEVLQEAHHYKNFVELFINEKTGT